MNINLTSIGYVSSPFSDRVLIPRNSGLCPLIKGQIHFDKKLIEKDFLKDLEGVSHLWVIFYFHQNKDSQNRATVRPPRLGGQKRIGTFATRSPYRPNAIGLSLIKLEAVIIDKLILEISGHDFLDGTPVLDIKPYLHYADSREQSAVAWLSETKVEKQKIFFQQESQIAQDHLMEIEQVLSVYPHSDHLGKVIKCFYRDYDLRWSQELEGIIVHDILTEIK